MVSETGALALVALAVLASAAVGAWYSRGRIGGVEDLISARDSAGPGTLAATVLASSMGAWILFSPAEAGAAFGGITAVVGYAVGSALPLGAYALLGPRIRRLIPEGHSLTEYAYARYGPAVYAYVLVVSVAYMFVFLAAELTGIASAVELLAGVPGWQTATLVGGVVLLYTAYGGLRASIATDAVQAVVVLPLLGVAAVATLLAVGGPVAAVETVASSRPELVTLGYLPGLEFGIYVGVAILAAEMLNQAWWQRVYAASDAGTLRRGYGLAALLVVPVVLLVGLFGPLAAGLGLVDGNASVALFLVVNDALPEWGVLAVALLAVLLVVSSADTLFNAIASVVTADLPRLTGGAITGDDLAPVARAFTGVVALAATVVGAQGYSVLTLFLLADLLAAATFLPLYHGLYSRRATGTGTLVASLCGLVVGLALFPPARGVLAPLGVAGVLPAPSFLWSFLGAAAVSGGFSALGARLSGDRFDLARLGDGIRRFDAEDEAVADGGRR